MSLLSPVGYDDRMALTTIKVPVELRDRISTDAKAHGVPTAVLLRELLDDWEHRRRMAAVGQAFATLAPEDEYWDEVRAWDVIASGLADD